MDSILVLDCGGQYAHLICRRIREIGVFSEVVDPGITLEEIAAKRDVKGLVISGGAASVYDEGAPRLDDSMLASELPMLGICYGHQLLAHQEGGAVARAASGEYGPCRLTVTVQNGGVILRGIPCHSKVWMSHGDLVSKLPHGYRRVAKTPHCDIAGYEHPDAKRCGLQFHPEVTHTAYGLRMLKNFIDGYCRAKKEWDNSTIVDGLYNDIRRSLRGKTAIIGLSGGIDSATACRLVEAARGKKNLTAVYVDSGLMREGEMDFVRSLFGSMGERLVIVDARKRFFSTLRGVVDPEEKRKRIGKAYIDVFREVAKAVDANVLIQGTIYSDRIESGATKRSSRIKSHHNVGGLPEHLGFEVFEPLKNLYKDEVRHIARMLGLPDKLITRHVFPGPGLAVRIVGEVTPEKAAVCQRANTVVEEELRNADLYESAWMGFAVLLPFQSVGVQGDARTYKHAVSVRVLESQDAMTANPLFLPPKAMETITRRITSEIPSVNRVLFDYTPKPPATMEYE